MAPNKSNNIKLDNNESNNDESNNDESNNDESNNIKLDNNESNNDELNNNESNNDKNEKENTVTLEPRLDNQIDNQIETQYSSMPEPSAPPLPEEINLTVDKNTLVSLCQNLNTNMLVNIAAYINVLDKLKDNESDINKKTSLQTNIDKLNDIKMSVSDLLNNVQTNLEVPSDKMIDPEKIIQDANNSNSSGIMTKLLGAELAAILSAMAAASVLMVGGSKYNRKKSTKGRRNKGNKKTKRNKRS
jgi:hypothetical protein